MLSLGPTPLLVYRSSGTSFSAPFVTGLAALLKQALPNMTTDDFKAILQASSEDLGTPGYDTDYGWGLIQAPEAIDASQDYFNGQSAPVEEPAEPDVPLDQQFQKIDQSMLGSATRAEIAAMLMNFDTSKK